MPPLAETQYRALASFRGSLRRFLACSESEARSGGLTSRQHQALLALRARARPPAVGELAEELQLRHHSAVGLLDRLEGLRLVARRADAGDARRVRIELTARGRRVLERLALAHRRELRRLAPELRRILEQLERA